MYNKKKDMETLQLKIFNFEENNNDFSFILDLVKELEV